MTTHKIYYLVCTNCGKEYAGEIGVHYAEEPESIKAEAEDDGWFCDVEVQNGSLWDFCSKKCRDNPN